MRELTKSVSALLVVVMLMSVVLCAPFTVSAIEQEETENATVEETTVAVQQETSTPNTEVTEPKTKPPVLLTSGSSDYITRAEWLHSLTETFNMTVEEDNYPDNYYSDISSLDSYYRDVMVAVEFGVIDLEAGEAFHPNDYTTRDFAASTLNFCLGYKLDSEKYTFSDVSSTEHPSDAQIAINRGWFELENNKFEPTKYITVGESTLMLEDAVNTMSQEKVNNNFSSKYEFADDVIVVPKSVPVSIGSDGTVTLTNYSETISSGNTFAVYAGDVPDVYTAVSVTKTGTQTVIKTKETEYDSAVTNVNAQGTSQVLDSYFELADGVELVDEELEAVSSPKSAVSVGAGTNSTAVGKEGNLAIKSKTLSKDLKIGDLKINLKVVLSNLNVKYIADKNTSHYMVKLDGDATITTNVSMQDVISALGGNSSVDLASYSVPGVGKVAISVFLNVKGEATITYDTLFSVGIEYTKSGGCRAIKSFTKKSFTIVANVTIDAGLKIYANVNILELIKGEIYATTGVKVVTSVNAYDDGKKPELCINIKGWWYVTLGYSATIVGQSYSDSLNVFNANNSPARLYAHYEDGKEVNSCTREASETKYVSPSTTKYGKISAPTSRESGSSLIDISYGSTTVDESWTLTSNREIYGDLNFKSGAINLNGYTLTVFGNLIQSGGVMYINNGTLNVGGDYRIQTILSNGDVADSSGCLQMTNNADSINIKGNFITQSSKNDSYNILNAGTMKISGNFYQYNGNNYNFYASGTHLVVLNGSDTQLVHFDSKSSHFNYLELTKDKTNEYVFDPDNCWNKLITKEDINSVKIYSQSTTVKQGDNLQFISKINGSNISTADVIWSISGNTDSNTSISDKGILSVSLNEKAKQITVTATSVADNTKSASVTITIEEIVPVINGIAITPSVASTVCGQSCQFNAVVFGFYNPSQSVIWSISGNKSSNTMIDSNGLLKIADNEISKQITVKAVSSAYKTITASVTVDVMQIKITSTVDNVTVTMETSETQQLKAVVTGTNNPSQKVVWSVSGNNSENTVINDNGEITIGKDETSSLIIVKAVSTEDSSKYGEFAISIKQNTLIGDTNGDGNVTIADATELQKYLANIVDFDDKQLAVADTNGDGNVDIQDATQIQKYLAQLIPSLG